MARVAWTGGYYQLRYVSSEWKEMLLYIFCKLNFLFLNISALQKVQISNKILFRDTDTYNFIFIGQFFLSWKNGTIKCVDGAKSLWSKTFFLNFHTQKLAHFRWDPEHAEVKKCTRSIWTQKYGYLEGCTLYTWVKNLFLFL